MEAMDQVRRRQYGALIIMIVAVVLSVIIMMVFAVPVGRFVNKHPTIQILGMSFLILIGFMLILEGGHLAHMEVFGSKIGAVPKGYLYFSIAFALLVEFLNMKLRKRQKPVQLHNAVEEATADGQYLSQRKLIMFMVYQLRWLQASLPFPSLQKR